MSQLTRRVFVDTAEILKAARGRIDRLSEGEKGADRLIDSVARDFAAYFRSENPRFDSDRFLKACGIKEA